MFPKPTAPHRGTVGTITGTAGRPSERSTGKIWISPTPTFTAVDSSDQQQWEYWDGAAWVSAANLGTITNLDYEEGIQWRTRLVNPYFNYFSSYITSLAANRRETDGESAFETTLNALGGWGTRTHSYDSGLERFQTILSAVPTELQTAYNYPGGIQNVWIGTVRHSTYPTLPDTVVSIFSALTTAASSSVTIRRTLTEGGVPAGYSPIGTWQVLTYWYYAYPDGPDVSGNLRTTSTFVP